MLSDWYTVVQSRPMTANDKVLGGVRNCWLTSAALRVLQKVSPYASKSRGLHETSETSTNTRVKHTQGKQDNEQ